MIETITPQDLKNLLMSSDTQYVYLDVRSPGEFEDFHLPGTTNIPLDQLMNHLSKLPKDKTIVTICAKGIRSAKASEVLLANGFDTVNLEGGLDHWLSSGTQL